MVSLSENRIRELLARFKNDGRLDLKDYPTPCEVRALCYLALEALRNRPVVEAATKLKVPARSFWADPTDWYGYEELRAALDAARSKA